jgi:VanZ family protein
MAHNKPLKTSPSYQEKQSLDSGSSHHRFFRYGPLALWLILIFIGSTSVLSASNTSVVMRFFHWLLPHADEAALRAIHFAIRKAGHFTEYAVLSLLAARAFKTSSHELIRRSWFWLSLALIIAYSLSDEFHQSFIPSRTASIYDSMIDSCGGLAALTVIWLLQRRTADARTLDQRPQLDSD